LSDERPFERQTTYQEFTNGTLEAKKEKKKEADKVKDEKKAKLNKETEAKSAKTDKNKVETATTIEPEKRLLNSEFSAETNKFGLLLASA